jgi:hypothetical protein
MTVTLGDRQEDPAGPVSQRQLRGGGNQVGVNACREDDQNVARFVKPDRCAGPYLGESAPFQDRGHRVQFGQPEASGVTDGESAEPSLADEPVEGVRIGTGPALLENLVADPSQRLARRGIRVDHREGLLVVDPHADSDRGGCSGAEPDPRHLETECLASDNAVFSGDIEAGMAEFCQQLQRDVRRINRRKPGRPSFEKPCIWIAGHSPHTDGLAQAA